jgi:hypothetical protein
VTKGQKKRLSKSILLNTFLKNKEKVFYLPAPALDAPALFSK